MSKLYKILHTETRHSVDGKEHWSILYLESVTTLFGRRCENWKRAIDNLFDTEEEAKKALGELKGGAV